MRGEFTLPVTVRERDLLLGAAPLDPDLTRLVRLPLAKDGWVTLRLHREELKNLLWAAFQAPGEDQDDSAGEELGAVRDRIVRVLRGEPALPDSVLPPRRDSLVTARVSLTLNPKLGECLRRHPVLTEDLPERVRRALSEGRSRPVRLDLGEALLLIERLREVSMSSDTADQPADAMTDVIHAVEGALDVGWGRAGGGAASRWYLRPVALSPEQRIPIAVRRRERADLEAAPGLFSEMAWRMLRVESETEPRLWLTWAEVDELARRLADLGDDARFDRLQNRLELIQRGFNSR